MKKFIFNEKGFSFLMVFFTMILISILGIGLISVSANSLKTSTNERNDQSVYYIAEAGLAVKKSAVEHELLDYYKEIKDYYDRLSVKEKLAFDFESEFYKKVEDFLDLTPTSLGGFEPQFGNTPSANIKISKVSAGNSPLEYKITSVGTIGKKERTVSQIITIDLNANTSMSGGGGSKYAVHTKGDIHLSGSAKIDGSAATESGKITFDNGSNKITGDIGASKENIVLPSYVNENEYFDKLTGHDNLSPIVLPPFPDDEFARLQALPYPDDLEVQKDDYNKTLVINKGSFLADNWITANFQYNMINDVHFKEFKVNGNNYITINVGNRDKNLFIENLNIEQGHIKIIGEGKLNIYVRDKFYIKGSFNSNGEYNKVNFYYANSPKVEFTGETVIAGSLYAKNANLEFTGGVGVQGNIYTGGTSLKIGGGSNAYSQYFYAPNARVEVTGGANIKGAIIADSFIASGGTSVTYDPGANGESNGVTEYHDAISLTKNSSIIEED